LLQEFFWSTELCTCQSNVYDSYKCCLRDILRDCDPRDHTQYLVEGSELQKLDDDIPETLFTSSIDSKIRATGVYMTKVHNGYHVEPMYHADNMRHNVISYQRVTSRMIMKHID